MGLEDILKQVEETGRDRAAAIRKDTTNEVESKMAEASSAAEEVVASIKSESNRKIEQLRQQEIPSAKLEVKRNQLEIQKDYRLDYRFSTLVERQWQENLPMVSEALFAE